MDVRSRVDVKRTLGVCYYPEHWDPSMWEPDIRRMLDVGLDTVRIAEFAWAKLEPSEGEFNIGYFDEFLDLCQNMGMRVIFGTPTAAPPIWLQRNYPEILNRDRQGHAIEGPRRNYTYNSPSYQKFADRITRKLAVHYGQHPAIVGWQLDNEPNCEVAEFFSEGDHDAFREYLREKYSTLDNLNDKLGMTFWSQSYSDWEHVRLGGSGLYGTVNPHLELEERRFFSVSAIRFLKRQIDILRRHIPENVYITTNGLFPNLDWNALVDAAEFFIANTLTAWQAGLNTLSALVSGDARVRLSQAEPGWDWYPLRPKVLDLLRPMMRVVNMEAAFTQRGWPELDGAWGFAVTDGTVPSNTGSYRFKLDGGTPSLTKTSADIAWKYRKLSPIFQHLSLGDGGPVTSSGLP